MEEDPQRPPADAQAPEERGWSRQDSGLILPPPRRSELPERIQEWAARVGTVAAAAAGLVVVVHLLGGIVMWLRFRKAGLPADQAVAFMSREELLTVGLRLIVLPAVATGALALVLVWAQRRRSQRGRRAAGSRPALVACAVLVALLFGSLPASWASVTWIGLGLVIVYWWRGFGLARRPPGASPSQWRLAAVAVLAAAVITLGRQVDEPVQLLQVEVALDKRSAPARGAFISINSDALYLGDTDGHRINAFRRADVRSVSLGPPLERAPNRSLLSMLLTDERWAITPLRWWCNGEAYAWTEIGRLCATQPFAVSRRRGLDIRWIPVRIGCPAQATTRCAGYLRFTTVRTYSDALGPFAAPRRVSFPNSARSGLPFVVPADRKRDVCVETNPEERALLRATPDGRTRPELPVRMEVVLSSDARGRSVLARREFKLDVLPGQTDDSLVPTSPCSAALRRTRAAVPGRPATATVVGVENGQTIVVRTGSERQRVRLLGIAAPQPETPGTFACGQREGIDLLLRRLFSAPRDSDGDRLADRPGGAPGALRLTPDPRRDDRDERSRLLRYVTVRGERRTLQEEILTAGWATAEPGKGAALAEAAAHARAQRAAQTARRGLLEAC